MFGRVLTAAIKIGTLQKYLTNVDNYSNQIDTYFASLSLEGKVDYIFQLAGEYLQASGMTEQLNALEVLSINVTYYAGGSVTDPPIVYGHLSNYQDSPLGFTSFANLGVYKYRLTEEKWYDYVSYLVGAAQSAAIELAANVIVYPQRDTEGAKWRENYFDSVGEGRWTLAQENSGNWELYA